MKRYESNITLVIKAMEGDREAFNLLVDQYYGAFMCIAYSHLPDKNLAEDVVQEAWLDIYHNLYQLKEPGKFLAWSRVIITRKAWACKKNNPDKINEITMTDLTDLQKYYVEKSSLGPDPHTQINSHLEIERVQKAIQRLPNKYRKVASLHYIQGLDYLEIAALLDITRFTADIRLRRVRHMLQTILNEKESL